MMEGPAAKTKPNSERKNIRTDYTYGQILFFLDLMAMGRKINDLVELYGVARNNLVRWRRLEPDIRRKCEFKIPYRQKVKMG